MTREESQIIAKLQKRISDLEVLLHKDSYSNLEIFRKQVEFKGDLSFGIMLDATTSPKKSTNIGFFGKAPVSVQTVPTTPSGGATQDGQARTTIGQIITILNNLGITQ
jgi:hypothetical protein